MRLPHHPRVEAPKVGDVLILKSGSRRKILDVRHTDGGYWVQYEGRVCLLTAGELSTIIAKGARLERHA